MPLDLFLGIIGMIVVVRLPNRGIVNLRPMEDVVALLSG